MNKFLTILYFLYALAWITGCKGSSDAEIYMKYNPSTGVSKGWATVNGQRTNIILEPEDVEVLSTK